MKSRNRLLSTSASSSNFLSGSCPLTRLKSIIGPTTCHKSSQSPFWKSFLLSFRPIWKNTGLSPKLKKKWINNKDKTQKLSKTFSNKPSTLLSLFQLTCSTEETSSRSQPWHQRPVKLSCVFCSKLTVSQPSGTCSETTNLLLTDGENQLIKEIKITENLPKNFSIHISVTKSLFIPKAVPQCSIRFLPQDLTAKFLVQSF